VKVCLLSLLFFCRESASRGRKGKQNNQSADGNGKFKSGWKNQRDFIRIRIHSID